MLLPLSQSSFKYTLLTLIDWKNRIPVRIAAITWVWDWTHSHKSSPTITSQWTTLSSYSPHLPFSLNDFKSFWLSFQSPFHLSLALLVCYRCLAMYLVLDVLYHPFRAILPNSSTRWEQTWWIDSIDYGTFTLIGRAFQLTSSIDRPQQYYSLHPTTGFDSIRGWTGPTSLAITEGIPVGFFSTADWYA